MVTVDRNLKHQQNLAALPIAVLVLCATTNDLDDLLHLVPRVLIALKNLPPKRLIEVTG